ncbi:MAG: PEP-CTERM sorting domain-containing protein [Planctomycetota bacterium]
MSKFYVVLGVVGVLLSAMVANATEISVNSAVVLGDDYDAPPAGVVPGAAPIADIGVWTETTNSFIADGVSPGPFEGDQYLRMMHPGSGNCKILHTLASPAGTPDDVVRIETMAYVPSDYAGQTAWFQFVGFDTTGIVGGANNSPLHTALSGNMIRYYDGTAYVDSTTLITFDTWQEWEIEYAVGSDTWSWLVDGVGDTALGINSRPTDTGIGSLQFFCNLASSGHPVYFDAIPEPTSISLLGLGAAGLLCTRRRR